jgi:hypothetical protein
LTDSGIRRVCVIEVSKIGPAPGTFKMAQQKPAPQRPIIVDVSEFDVITAATLIEPLNIERAGRDLSAHRMTFAALRDATQQRPPRTMIRDLSKVQILQFAVVFRSARSMGRFWFLFGRTVPAWSVQTGHRDLTNTVRGHCGTNISLCYTINQGFRYAG